MIHEPRGAGSAATSSRSQLVEPLSVPRVLLLAVVALSEVRAGGVHGTVALSHASLLGAED